MEMLAISSPVSLVHLVLFHNGVWQVENTTICGSEWHSSPVNCWLGLAGGPGRSVATQLMLNGSKVLVPVKTQHSCVNTVNMKRCAC